MIGTKKLSTIREELEKAFAVDGMGPIQWLDQQIALARRKGRGTEIMEGLQQFLKAPPKRNGRKQPGGAKKQRARPARKVRS